MCTLNLDYVLERVFLSKTDNCIGHEPDPVDVEQFLTLGSELCRFLISDYFTRNKSELGIRIDQWALFGASLYYALPECQREKFVSLCFHSFRACSEHTGWHPWDGQFTVFEANYDLHYRQVFFRHYCMDAIRRQDWQGFQNWFGTPEALLNYFSFELSPPLQQLAWQSISTSGTHVIEYLAEALEVSDEEAHTRLGRALLGKETS